MIQVRTISLNNFDFQFRNIPFHKEYISIPANFSIKKSINEFKYFLKTEIEYYFEINFNENIQYKQKSNEYFYRGYIGSNSITFKNVIINDNNISGYLKISKDYTKEYKSCGSIKLLIPMIRNNDNNEIIVEIYSTNCYSVYNNHSLSACTKYFNHIYNFDNCCINRESHITIESLVSEAFVSKNIIIPHEMISKSKDFFETIQCWNSFINFLEKCSPKYESHNKELIWLLNEKIINPFMLKKDISKCGFHDDTIVLRLGTSSSVVAVTELSKDSKIHYSIPSAILNIEGQVLSLLSNSKWKYIWFNGNIESIESIKKRYNNSK